MSDTTPADSCQYIDPEARQKTFSFYEADALKYGVEQAIVLRHLRYWVEINMANRRNLEDGRHWTYNSAEALTQIFPFWNRRKIARLLDGLENAGAIASGCYNRNPSNRTKWYTTQTQVDPLADLTNQPLVKSDQSTLDRSDQSTIEQISNTDGKQLERQEPAQDSPESTTGIKQELVEADGFTEAWADYVKHRRQMRKKINDVSGSRLKKKINQYPPEDVIMALHASVESGWTGVFPEKYANAKHPRAQDVGDKKAEDLEKRFGF